MKNITFAHEDAMPLSDEEKTEKNRIRCLQYYRKHRDERLVYAKRQRETLDKEKTAAYFKVYNKINREKIAAKKKQTREENPEINKKRCLENYYKNREERIQKVREHYHATKDINREKNNALRRANAHKYKDAKRINQNNRRARKMHLLNTFTLEEKISMLQFWHGACAVCHRLPAPPLILSDDHWIPLASADCPGSIATNIVPLCHGLHGCNNSKGRKDPSDWLIQKFGPEKATEIEHSIQAYFLTLVSF